MQNTEKKDWLSKLDEKIDNGIASCLPSPLNRAYLAYNRWCNRHGKAIVITLLILSAVASAMVVINNHYYPNRK